MKKLFVLVVLGLVIACGDDDDSEKETFACGKEVSLVSDVKPIIQSSCSVPLCHSDGVAPFLNTSEQIISKSARIAVRVENGTMPPSSEPPLTSEEKELILCWVEDGAPDN